jgi:RimJ/RimL family protein N-acetyltransferase
MRDFTSGDAPNIASIVKHPNFGGYRRLRPEHVTEDVQIFIKDAIAQQYPKNGLRDIYRLAICLKNNPQEIIGYCVFHGWNSAPKEDDHHLGYFLNPEYKGQGYITEAVYFVIKAYFLQYPDRRVCAQAHPNNLASQRILEKLGFKKTGSITIDVHNIQEPRLTYRIFQGELKHMSFSEGAVTR